MSDAGEIAEAYRVSEQRLRLLLLGDGLSEPGLVKGEEARLRITTALRHMREALAAALEEDAHRAEAAQKVATQVTELQEELLRLASQAIRKVEPLLTPAEVAREAGLSVDTVYRAVKRNEIAALRAGRSRSGPIRIPASEVSRLHESRR